MKNIITSILAATIIAAMAVSLFFVCYLVYDALPIWFQYSLGLGCFYALVTTATINLWGKAKGFRKKDKLKKSYKQFIFDKNVEELKKQDNAKH